MLTRPNRNIKENKPNLTQPYPSPNLNLLTKEKNMSKYEKQDL